jgi:hypothetical protein
VLSLNHCQRSNLWAKTAELAMVTPYTLRA